MSRCRSCNDEVIWVTSAATGKNIPINPEPVLGGNLFLADGVVTVRQPQPDVLRHVTHFSTCPDANQWRKP
jgi:hypothetical protein